MHTPSLAADILAGLIAIAIPLTGPFERRIYRTNPKTPLKLLVYGANVALLWILATVAVWNDGLGLLFQSPAAGTTWLWAPAIFNVVLAAAVGAYAVCGLLPLVQSLRGPRWRRAYAAAYRRSLSDIPGMLPSTAIERMAWVPMSFTAGICEEVLCRGFLIRFLHESVFGMPIVAALGVSSLIFGLAHVYQGTKGVLGTTIAGLAFGLLFLLSGNLIAGIILHVLVDLQVPFVLRPIPGDADIPAEAA